jgi:hypothetical protein
MGFRATSNSRSRPIAFLAGGAGAIVVVGLILALARPPAVTHPSPSPTPTAVAVPTPPPGSVQAVVPLDLTAHLDITPHAVNAMSVNPGFVWLATQGVTDAEAGTLIRVDATDAQRTGSWAIGGDPVAVAAGGDFVWVANSFGDGSTVLPEQNTVEQFNATTGALVHVYRVTDPRGLVANPTSALVISADAGQQTAISLLTGGSAKIVATLQGSLNVPLSALSPEVAVAVCSGRAFVALTTVLTSSSNVAIYSMPPSGVPIRRVATIPNDYEASIACDSTSLFLLGAAGDGDVSVARVSSVDGSLTNLWEGPYPVALASLSGRVWIAYADDSSNQSFLTSLDPVTGIAATARSPLPIPPNSDEPGLLIAGASGLWLAASQGNQLLHIATG